MLRKVLAFLGLVRATHKAAPSRSLDTNAPPAVALDTVTRTQELPASAAGLSAPPSRIASLLVVLPPDRLRLGTLLVLDADGTLLSGPWPANGRANQQFAASKGNPTRSRTLPFGDVPTGSYELFGKSETPAGSAAAFGPLGALSFSPLDGEAAAAEAIGRTVLLLHGGRDWRASTDGSLRIPNLAMEEILSMLPADLAALRPRVRFWVGDAKDCDDWRADPTEGSQMRQVWAKQTLLGRSRRDESASINSGTINEDPFEGTFPSMFLLLYLQGTFEPMSRDEDSQHMLPPIGICRHRIIH